MENHIIRERATVPAGVNSAAEGYKEFVANRVGFYSLSYGLIVNGVQNEMRPSVSFCQVIHRKLLFLRQANGVACLRLKIVAIQQVWFINLTPNCSFIERHACHFFSKIVRYCG